MNINTFILECINRIKIIKPNGQQCNQLLDTVVTIIKYKKSTIDHSIYIKVFYDATVSYPAVYTDDDINTDNNGTAFPELRIFLKNILILHSKKDISLIT